MQPETTAAAGRALRNRKEETRVSPLMAQWDISVLNTSEKQAAYLIT